MARNQSEPCMFCNEPHTGNCGDQGKKPAAKKAAPKARVPLSSVERVKPAASTTPKAGSSGVASTSSPAPVEAGPPSGHEDVAPRVRTGLAGVARVRSLEDEQLAYAITCFAAADMLHYETLEENRGMIDLPKHRIDSMIWKQVNKDVVERRNK